MRPDFLQIFKIATIALLLALGTQVTTAQSKEKIEIKYKVDSVKVQDVYQFNITIKVKNGTGPFTYYVFLGEPWKDGQVLKEMNNVSEVSYTFLGLPRSNNYHVGVKGATKYDVIWIYVKP